MATRRRILVRVDHSALMQGHAQGDELCDIAGVGPVSVLRQLWPDAVEVDHRLGYAKVGRTRLDELDPLCRHCHGLKTNSNWQLVAGRGRRRLVPPGHPDHPGGPGHPSVAGRGEAGRGRRLSSTRLTTWPEPPPWLLRRPPGGPTAR